MISASEAVHHLPKARILVVGDLILDHYIRGTTERTSPEAPVPVVLFRNEEATPGGAANVARNIAAAGAATICAGAVGDDEQGAALVRELEKLGVDCSAIIRLVARPTTAKTRIISHNQQVLRLDREETGPISQEASAELIEKCVHALTGVGAVILSDYAKGTLTAALIERMIAECAGRGIPLFVDPKGRDYSRYKGAFCLTPNAKEAFEATGINTSATDGLTHAAQLILETTSAPQLVITRGADGVALYQCGQDPILIPTAAREVFDVTGAGDTFVAFLALATAVGLECSECARLANAAAGVVVGKSGAATVTLTELRNALAPGARARKLRSSEELEELGNDLRRSNRKIVFTNGCFDFIHVGHVAFFEQARSLGDVLIVATNTDEMITELKGAPRPIIRQEQREKLLAAIEAVDYIVPFAARTPHDLIRALRPDYLVKGNNYTMDQVEGQEIVEEYGGKVRLLDVIHEINTSELIQRTNPGS